MKELTINGKQILVVDVNTEAKNFQISSSGWLIGYLTLMKLPPGEWQILNRAGEISEEQWKGLVEAHGKGYVDYNPTIETDEDLLKAFVYAFETATLSGKSWLKEKGIDDKALLILKK